MQYLLAGMMAILLGCSGSGGAPDMSADMAIFIFPAGCNNGIKDGDETDIDCGGSCMPCGADQGCSGGKDCKSGVCVNRSCIAATCNDGIKNGDESDVDCGGSCPNKCAEGEKCRDGIDCQSGTCANNVCTPSLCSDGKQDGMETDIDCGGPICPKCAIGAKCKLDADCRSGKCPSGKCVAVMAATLSFAAPVQYGGVPPLCQRDVRHRPPVV